MPEQKQPERYSPMMMNQKKSNDEFCLLELWIFLLFFIIIIIIHSLWKSTDYCDQSSLDLYKLYKWKSIGMKNFDVKQQQKNDKFFFLLKFYICEIPLPPPPPRKLLLPTILLLNTSSTHTDKHKQKYCQNNIETTN